MYNTIFQCSPQRWLRLSTEEWPLARRAPPRASCGRPCTADVCCCWSTACTWRFQWSGSCGSGRYVCNRNGNKYMSICLYVFFIIYIYRQYNQESQSDKSYCLGIILGIWIGFNLRGCRINNIVFSCFLHNLLNRHGSNCPFTLMIYLSNTFTFP